LNLSYQSFVAMLTAPPSLRNLCIQGSLNVTNWPLHVNGPEFSINNLKALRLPDNGIHESLFGVKILLAISAPNLESLWLGSSYDKYGHFFNASQIVGQTVKFPVLKYLTMPSYNLSYCVEFSNAFPTITHLHLPSAGIYHNPQFETIFASHWRHLDTLVTASLRQSQMPKFHHALSKVLPLRRNTGYPIRQILVDEDLRTLLKKQSPNVSHYVKIGKLSLETYQEPWWVMSHERHMDDP